MLTIIIVMFLFILFYILGMVGDKKLSKTYKVSGVVRVLLFSGGGIVIIILGLFVGYVAAWCFGTISPGKYKKMMTDKIIVMEIEGEKYHYIKKLVRDGKNTVVTLKFCCLNGDGDLNFRAYNINKKRKDNFYINKNVKFYICKVEPCNFKIDYYKMVSIDGIMKYFAIVPPLSSFRIRVYVPRNVNVKEVYM